MKRMININTTIKYRGGKRVVKLTSILFCFNKKIGVSGKKTNITSKRTDNAIANIGYEI